MIIDRWNQIISTLTAHKEISVTELAKQIDVSIATIRRDIKELSKRKYLTCKNGIVSLQNTDRSISPDIFQTDNIVMREATNAPAKTALARYAASLIEAGDIVFIDAGTTVPKMIPYIKADNVMIVTNSATALPLLISSGIPTYVCGGYLTSNSGAIYNSMENIFNGKHIDKAFLGANSVTKDGYFSSSKDTTFKKEVLSHSTQAYVLADSSKFAKTSFLNFALPNEILLITDKEPPFEQYTNYIVIDE